MKYVEIHDSKRMEHFSGLSFDLKEILEALGQSATKAHWAVMPETEECSEALFATGNGSIALEELARSNERVSGSRLAEIARDTRQIIWGEFRAYKERLDDKPWVVIVAFDSSWYEVYSEDETVFRNIRSSFQDVRPGGYSYKNC
jgi:hypothetical protein